MAQAFTVLTPDAHVMLANSVVMGCTVPGHLADTVQITSWILSERGNRPLELRIGHHGIGQYRSRDLNTGL